MGVFGNTFGRLYSYSEVVIPEVPEVNTIYIDPDSITNGVGTVLDPKKTLVGLTITDDYTYKFKADTEYTTSVELSMAGKTGVTFTSYGTGALPKYSFTGTGTCAIRFAGSTNCTVENLDVSTDITKSVVTIFQFGTGTNYDGGAGLTVQNCKIHNVKQGSVAGGMGLRGGGTNISILNNEIYDTGDDGMYMASTVNLIVGYNNIHHVNQNYAGTSKGFNSLGGSSAGDGIQLAGTWANYHVHHNIIDRTDVYTGNKYCMITNRTLGTPVTDGGIIEYNTFSANANVLGQVILAFNLNTIIRYNTFIGDMADYVEGAFKLSSNTCVNTIIHNNLFYDIKGRGISLSSLSSLGSINTKVYNNVFYNFQTSSTLYKGAIWCNYTNPDIANNIFHMAGNTGVAFTNYNGTSTLTIRNNCFDVLTSTGTPGQGTNAVIGNPLFVDAANNDFHLQLGSPCIDKGVNVSILKDYDGINIPQGAAPDIGAFEFI